MCQGRGQIQPPNKTTKTKTKYAVQSAEKLLLCHRSCVTMTIVGGQRRREGEREKRKKERKKESERKSAQEYINGYIKCNRKAGVENQATG